MMLLGSGELAKELAISFQRLGAEVIVVDAGKGGPAQGVADRAVLAPIGESERLYDLIEKERPRFVLPLVEAASREALDKLAEGEVTQVIPTAKAVRLAGDREGCGGWRPRNSACPPQLLVCQLGRRATHGAGDVGVPGGGAPGGGGVRPRAVRGAARR